MDCITIGAVRYHLRKYKRMDCITIDVTLCVGGSKASAGQYLDIARGERGQYPDIAREGGFQLSLDPPFDPTFHL